MVSASLLSALIQAIVMAIILAITLVGIALWFSGKISDITTNISSIDDAVGEVEGAVSQVDLKEIEKTVLRLEYALDAEVEGGNSVLYELPQSGIETTISLAAEPSDELIDPVKYTEAEEFLKNKYQEDSWQSLIESYTNVDESPDEVDKKDLVKQMVPNGAVVTEEGMIKTEADLENDEVTYIILEFDQRIRSRAVTDKIGSDKELAELEIDKFGYECGFKALSPLEMQFSVPCSDFNTVANWIPELLAKIDQYHCAFEEEAEKFDQELESALENR